MIPLLILMTSAALTSASSSEDSAGRRFTVVFPENIAYYHPKAPTNMIQLSATQDGTDIEICTPNEEMTKSLNSGETEVLFFDAAVELKRTNTSYTTVKITSNKKIIVHAISSKSASMQMALIIPHEKLGTKYFIPPAPTTTGSPSTNVTEQQPFKLIIINLDQDNTVKIKGKVNKTIDLAPHQVALVFNESYRVVEGVEPMAVIISHACAMKQNCTCSLLYTVLPRLRDEKQKFFIPPVIARDAEDETFILLSDGKTTEVQKYNPESPKVEIKGIAILYRPGLLVNLIPERDFATCYVINGVAEAENTALIMVHKDHTDGVHLGNDSLSNPDWEPLEGTDYVATTTPLQQGKNIIWHSSETMAVYMKGSKGDSLFAHQGAIVSRSPDYRGCVLSPEAVEIGDSAIGWRESIQYCREKGQELMRIPDSKQQTQINQLLSQLNANDLRELWFALRRSSHTEQWYWVGRQSVEYTNWAQDEPGTAQEGQCAVLSTDRSKNYGWSDKSCCQAVHPVCYQAPVFYV